MQNLITRPLSHLCNFAKINIQKSYEWPSSDSILFPPEEARVYEITPHNCTRRRTDKSNPPVFSLCVTWHRVSTAPRKSFKSVRRAYEVHICTPHEPYFTPVTTSRPTCVTSHHFIRTPQSSNYRVSWEKALSNIAKIIVQPRKALNFSCSNNVASYCTPRFARRHTCDLSAAPQNRKKIYETSL